MGAIFFFKPARLHGNGMAETASDPEALSAEQQEKLAEMKVRVPLDLTRGRQDGSDRF